MQFNRDICKQIDSQALFLADTFPEHCRCSIDSRTLQKGDIFIALSGERVDGHSYIEQALKKGASGIICAIDQRKLVEAIDSSLWKNKFVVLVQNTHTMLIELARLRRRQFTNPVVAITGSVGKTSTKELVAHILRKHKVSCWATIDNQNTLLGVALNILQLRDDHQVAIFEVGISKRGEMKEIADVLRPTNAAITCVAHSHMAGLGSLHDIAAEKRMIFSFFRQDCIGVVNGDQPILAQVSYPHPTVRFGSKTVNQVQARKIQVGSSDTTFVLRLYRSRYQVRIPSNHEGAVLNALAAAAIAHILDVPHEIIAQAIQEPLVIKGRFERKKLKDGSGILINDAYNANPESMKAALLALERVQTTGRKVAVIGDMLELGVNTSFWHRQVGRFLRKVPSLRNIILVGDLVKWTKATVPLGVSVQMVDKWQDAVDLVKEQLTDDAVVLIKGSNALGLTNLVHELCVEDSVQ